jgi:pimeloyl-ACP methyl ester carboxylesterase
VDPRWTAGGVASTCGAGKPSSQRAHGITDTYKEQLGADLFALTRAARREPMNPDTIVLIHGFWVTPRSWEQWKAHYEQQGYRVLTPAYPGFEVEVEALNADPTRSRT